MSALSPVRSLLAAGPPGDLQHDRAAPARRRARPLSGCLPAWRAGCPATPETGPACPPTSAPRQSTVPVDCADRQADGIGHHRRLRRRSRGSNLAPRPIRSFRHQQRPRTAQQRCQPHVRHVPSSTTCPPRPRVAPQSQADPGSLDRTTYLGCCLITEKLGSRGGLDCLREHDTFTQKRRVTLLV